MATTETKTETTVVTERTKLTTDLKSIIAILGFCSLVSVGAATFTAVSTYRIDRAEADISDIREDRSKGKEKNTDLLMKLDRRLSRIEGALDVKHSKDDELVDGQ